VSDDIEIHFGEEHGLLDLSCGMEAFADFRAVVLGSDRLKDLSDIDPADVLEIRIACYRSERPAKSFSEYLAICGCWSVLAAVLFVFGVGVTTIVGWLLARI
jgi:hypothetical protein